MQSGQQAVPPEAAFSRLLIANSYTYWKVQFQFLMIRITITLIIFSFSIYTVGQQPGINYKNQIKLTPPKMIDYLNQGIELNYERSYARKFASELSAAYMANIITTGNFKGFRIGVEEKRFLSQGSKTRGYFSTQLVYNNSALKESEYLGFDTSTNRNNIPPYKIVKKTAAINLKLGFEYMHRHFVFDYFFGFGIKYREVKHIDRKYPFPKPAIADFFYDTKAEGTSWVINLPTSFKIGYIF